MRPSAAWTSTSSCSSVSSVWVKKPGQHLKQHLISEVEQLGDPAGQRLGRLQLRLVDVVGLLHEGGHDGLGGLKGRVLFTQFVVFAPECEEPAVMRWPPVPAWPLTLLDDLLDTRARRRQIPDREELPPADPLRGGLRPRLPTNSTGSPTTSLVSAIIASGSRVIRWPGRPGG